jgi:hypothetical protein
MVMPVARTPGFAAFKQLTFDLSCPNSLFHGPRISDSGNSVFLRLREVSNVCNLKCVCSVMAPIGYFTSGQRSRKYASLR